ncbi:hypothetical protein PR048_015343 [Dryococelus australis]|uniref:Uncharacterized protein n=1 Tax=Dryococelus australis TaxID=614101 RepID=A0ABQ9HGP2_9NEOP|nr:hypothetical protein PR048_015343 [Dryococelus australis]
MVRNTFRISCDPRCNHFPMPRRTASRIRGVFVSSSPLLSWVWTLKRLLAPCSLLSGDPRENQPTSGIVQHYSHMRKSGRMEWEAGDFHAAPLSCGCADSQKNSSHLKLLLKLFMFSSELSIACEHANRCGSSVDLLPLLLGIVLLLLPISNVELNCPLSVEGTCQTEMTSLILLQDRSQAG